MKYIGGERKGYESKWLILTAVMLGSIMGPIDASIVNTVLPTITNYFDSEISIAQWVPTVYLLTISSLLLLYGRLGDMLGYKRVYLFGLAGFTASSVLCALSPTIEALIAFRAVQGLSAGMMMAVSFAIITAAFPPQERGKALGVGSIGIATGLALGPTLGGTITDFLEWRYVFLINVPVGIAALFWASRIIPAGERKAGQRLDLPGALVAFILLLSFLLFANRGDSWGWLSPAALTLLFVALVSAVSFFIVETKSTQPMLNLALFSDRTFRFANLSSMLNFMALYIMVFLTPFYLMLILRYSPAKVGYIMTASPVVMLVAAPISGALSDRIGSRGLAALGTSVAALSLFLMSTLDASASSFDVIWRLAIVGLGTGIFQSPNNSSVMGSVPPTHLGISSGILASMRNVGMVLGIAIAGAILYSSVTSPLPYNPGSFDGQQTQAFLTGLQRAYWAGAAIAGIAVFTSIAAMRRKPATTSTEVKG